MWFFTNGNGFLIYNSKNSFAYQLVATLAIIILLSTGATLTICLSFCYSVGSTSYKIANSIIRNQTESNILNSALVIAQAIESEILLAGSSICLKGAKYSAALVSNGTRIHKSKITTVLKPVDTFQEFNYLTGCTYPNCPKDYGPLVNKSRVSYSGSLLSSSLYVRFKNGSHTESVRTSARYAYLLSAYPDAAALVDILGPQDLDLRSILNFGPNSTAMFYLSTLYPISSPSGVPSGASYLALHRTFPGMLKNSTTYDPSSRPWFVDAPIGDFYIYGPYLETFTQLLSITISSRTSTPLASPSQGSKYITNVATSVILLKYLADIINGVDYPNSGKGILLNYQTLEVIVSGKFNAANLYGKTGFKLIKDLDPNLAKFNLRTNNNFEYTDSSGVNWIVVTVPFVEHVAYSTGVRSYAFIMIVLSRSDEALRTIPDLAKLIDGTMSTILGVTIAICVGTAVILLTLVYFVVKWLTKPLDKIRSLSMQIVEISAEEVTSRSYLHVIEDGQTSFVVRWDEIGSLVLYFWEMVNKLHLDNVKKKKRAKYPPNPFFVSGSISSSGFVDPSTRWSQFEQTFRPRSRPSIGGNDDAIRIESQLKHTTTVVSPVQAAIYMRNGVAANYKRNGVAANYKRNGVVANEDEATTLPISTMSSVTSFGSSTLVRPIHSCIPSSLRMYWYVASLLLMTGLTLAMLATVFQLQGAGTYWMTTTGTSMTSKQLLDLSVVANAKAKFAWTYFVEMQMNLLSIAHFQTAVLDGNLTRANLSTQDYLPSYSLDATNYYSSPVTDSVKFSGYFVNASMNCKTQQKCALYQYSQEIKQTSLFDLHLQSYFHSYSRVDFSNAGLASGLTRIWPYGNRRGFEKLQQCYIDHQSSSLCKSKYMNSKCAHPTFKNLTYPPFDPRCRSWYNLAMTGGDPNKLYVYSRIASSGNLDVTVTTPLRKGASKTGNIYGALNLNTIISFLSDSINSIKILRNGYCYLIDTKSPGQLIIHPKLHFFVTGVNIVSTVKAVEGFSDAEYQDFFNNVLRKLNSSTSITASYQKDGQTWYLASSSFVVSSVAYSLIATVPLSDILAASNLVQQEISSNTQKILLGFIIALAVFFFMLFFVSVTVVRAVVQPLNDLREICQKVASGNYDVEVPKSPSTLDMKILLDAFSDMLVAIKFGGENFARGHLDIAQKVFQESLRLYAELGNKRGVGVSQNNLGAVCLHRGDYVRAESYFRDAVANARSMIEEVTSWESAGRCQRVLSDRLGNLAVAYMEQGRIEDATDLLFQAMEEDKRQNYVRGYVVKQGTLGLILLKRKAYKSATRVISDALCFASSRTSGILDEHWTNEEATVTEQIALCNIGLLHETQGHFTDAEEAYIDSLTFHKIMHVSTTNKALMALRTIFFKNNRHDDVLDLENIAAANNFKIDPFQSSSVKRIFFVLEMTVQVEKIHLKDMLIGVRQLQANCTTSLDLCEIVHSVPGGVRKDFPLSKVYGREKVLDSKLNGFLANSRKYGSPVKSLMYAVDALNDESLSTVDWIVLCTDSNQFDKRDDAFMTLRVKLSQVVIGLVVISLGESPSEVLHELVSSSRNGVYLHARPNTTSIEEAFAAATKFIKGDSAYSKGQLILEEM